MKVTLSHAHQITYDSVFQHPISHNVEWRKLLSLFNELGQVVNEHNGSVRITRNGHNLLLRPSAKEVTDMGELMKIRHFLASSSGEETPASGPGTNILVVVDHREARIFESEISGSVPIKLVPYDPHGFGRHVHNIHDHAEGQHHPVPKSFFEAIASHLIGVDQILVFGVGSGGGSAMNELMTELWENHKDLFEHVIGSEVVDEQHLTENELLAKARDFYESRFISRS
jgi:hypothetical protein